MITKRTLRATSAFVAAVLMLLSGCQTYNEMVAKFSSSKPKPAQPLSAPEPTPVLTKAQKIDVQMAIARSYENDGAPDQAISVYRDVVKNDNRRVEAYRRLAILHDMKGDWQTARQNYQLALEKAPRNASLHCDCGQAFDAPPCGLMAQAIEQLQEFHTRRAHEHDVQRRKDAEYRWENQF